MNTCYCTLAFKEKKAARAGIISTLLLYFVRSQASKRISSPKGKAHPGKFGKTKIKSPDLVLREKVSPSNRKIDVLPSVLIIQHHGASCLYTGRPSTAEPYVFLLARPAFSALRSPHYPFSSINSLHCHHWLWHHWSFLSIQYPQTT